MFDFHINCIRETDHVNDVENRTFFIKIYTNQSGIIRLVGKIK